MIRSVLLISSLLLPSAAGAATRPTTTSALPPSYGLSTLAAHTRDDDRVCLVEKKTRHLVCKTRAGWRQLAQRLEAKAGA